MENFLKYNKISWKVIKELRVTRQNPIKTHPCALVLGAGTSVMGTFSVDEEHPGES